MTDAPSDRVRLDRWLWAARFFKTRALATAAIAGGKVRLNGDRAKPSKLVRVGDRLELRLGPFEHLLTVRGLSERRGRAKDAAVLFEESAESRAERERVAFRLKAANLLFVPDATERPTKRDRRRLDQFRRKAGWE